MTSYFEQRIEELRANPPAPRAKVRAGVRMVPDPAPEPTGKIGNIYFAVAGDHVKIGFATNMTSRLQSLRTGNHEKMQIHSSFNSYQEAEQILHKHFKKIRVRGEWFKMCFEVEELWDDIMDYQGTYTPRGDDPDAPGSGRAFLARMSSTFIPLDHVKKILAYSGKPWPADLFAS